MRRPLLLLAALFLAVIGLIAAKSLLIEPPPVRAHSAPGQFDTSRAKARLAFILGDQRPHPTDSEADHQVRARLIAMLAQIGLKAIARDPLACNELYKPRGS